MLVDMMFGDAKNKSFSNKNIESDKKQQFNETKPEEGDIDDDPLRSKNAVIVKLEAGGDLKEEESKYNIR